MHRDTFILDEGDDADTPMSNVVSLFGSDEPMLLGDLAAIIVSDAAVKMRGNFDIPRLVVVSRPLGGVETD